MNQYLLGISLDVADNAHAILIMNQARWHISNNLVTSEIITIMRLKQMQEFGVIGAGQKVAGMLLFLTDVQGVGLDIAQDLTLTTAFYWDMDDATREWSARYSDRMEGKKPTMVHAGVYSAVMNYLKAAEASGQAKSGSKVMDAMRDMDINDFFNRNASLREDGRVIHDMFLVRVKKPSESTSEGDLYEVLATIPGKDAFASLDNSTCPLVKK